MVHDIYLVAGVILAALAIPAVLSAWSDGRALRGLAIIVLISGGLIGFAVYRWPGTMSLGDIPDAFVRVVARIL
ncbi:MAG: hypothetical protein CVT80_10990 [Alphaproteobacteria bacterium HGW-Alphaproteobacteria-2]|nr:MAG: hypothetical protein CVT80_10990 [Alphaproteobacteria bacterium HGW-Alphaproteobacteria-2]